MKLVGYHDKKVPKSVEFETCQGNKLWEKTLFPLVISYLGKYFFIILQSYNPILFNR